MALMFASGARRLFVALSYFCTRTFPAFAESDLRGKAFFPRPPFSELQRRFSHAKTSPPDVPSESPPASPFFAGIFPLLEKFLFPL